MSANSQSQSSFINCLPREIRNAIYLELWRSSGLRQHIIWNGSGADAHFCRWQCSMEFEVQDRLQQDIEELMVKLQVPLGEKLLGDQHENAPLYCRRLQSPWMNHWPCGERAYEKHGLGALRAATTSTFKCWKKEGMVEQDGHRSSAYFPMLLSCKLISAECLQSIYESTTFIFTDFRTLQMFFGFCELHPAMREMPKLGITPPAFFRYTRSLELSLSPDFPKHLLCANTDLPGIERRHDVYDFHWLRLDQFKNLERVNIWIAARSITCRLDSDNNLRGIKEFDFEEMRKLLAPFRNLKSFMMSTPLAPSVGPEEGTVIDVVPSHSNLYKRNSGDKFHPFLSLIELGSVYDGMIFSSPIRGVRLARNGGSHDLMKEV